MLRCLDHRAGHYVLLAIVWALLCLPNLGGPSLWDIDEGNNANAAREMYESGDWVVPYFNARMRYDKPALLYWLQASAYGVFGINELSARLPSALAALLTILVTYELGRSAFGRSAGLISAVVLASCVAVCGSARFANPDALLDLFTALALWCFWKNWTAPRWGWWLGAGAASGLAVLAKGPVGLVLPCAVVGLFLLWRRQPFFVLQRRLWWAVLAFCLVGLPWYIWVGVETKWQWPYHFWVDHNLHRFEGAMEGHRGPFFYYALALVGGLAPWSIFLGPTAWLTWRGSRGRQGDETRPAFQFLASWFAVYFFFFSAASTKLPNYVLPLYPAVAVLTGCFLDRWRRGELVLPAWVMRVSVACLALMGVGVGVGLLAAGGALPVAALRPRAIAGLESCAVLGAVLVAGAFLAARYLRNSNRTGALVSVAAAAVAFLAPAAAWAPAVIDTAKAPRSLVAALPANQLRRDLRAAAFHYFQPSLVFYCRRQVGRLETDSQVFDALAGPLPTYVFLPETEWQRLTQGQALPWHIVARHHDLYDNRDVVVVTNDATNETASASPRDNRAH